MITLIENADGSFDVDMDIEAMKMIGEEIWDNSNKENQ